jgi:hypothetical protein
VQQVLRPCCRPTGQRSAAKRNRRLC